MQNAEMVLSITEHKARTDVSYTFDRIYRNFFNPDFFLKAYSNKYAKEGNMTSGTDGSTIDGFGLDRISNAIEALKSEKYHFHPVRRVNIPKKNGKLRPLGIPAFMDKIVQEIARSFLEAMYEPQFSNNSHGFRPNCSCHTALKQIKREWTGVKWVIEGDIKGFFDNISHDLLLDTLKEKIKDGRFIELIRRMLKAGYIEDWNFHNTYSGTPQGGVISPILANIYLDKLDKFIEQVIIPKYQTDRARRKPNLKYVNSLHKMKQLSIKIDSLDKDNIDRRQFIVKYKSLASARRKMSSVDPMDREFVRIKYVRYADDFVIGVIGNKELTVTIRDEVSSFLKEQLKLDLSAEKTLITHFNDKRNPVNFLGYELYTGDDDTAVTTKKNGIVARNINGIVRLKVPAKAVHEKLSRFATKGKSIHRAELMGLDLAEIIVKYASEVRGLYNYYRLADNVAYQLGKFKFFHVYSLAKTIAAKMKISVRSVWKKYKVDGTIGIIVDNKSSGKQLTFKYYNEGFAKNDFVANANSDVDVFPRSTKVQTVRSGIIKRLLAHKCELCGKEDSGLTLEVHHVRKLKDLKKKYRGSKEIPKWVWLMSTRNRKTLVLCKGCHVNLHANRL
ncbi:hypothetical protein B1A99_24920 [Cohnella sp. CIP 111063]|uniref:reverse transcriptase/maturase family protein n=1 Tax=unclassified Cohnella TaxID=2636738 RepID=UPI000B8C3E75|nr:MULTISPECIES: reverse transcriptase/maturase family protein [unclassified Cohnella]OXS55025.1 hypothetical protein B1A99_24920 [Cohnella sp. CIP 111063]PRX65160.1 group II intron reverse transcriptase/maturase [Cohnella sp. SGD-V74]